jgi:hypothetical protein
MSRPASDSPAPAWGVWLTLLVGLVADAGVVWFAAKVFKIGLFMDGKHELRDPRTLGKDG